MKYLTLSFRADMPDDRMKKYAEALISSAGSYGFKWEGTGVTDVPLIGSLSGKPEYKK